MEPVKDSELIVVDGKIIGRKISYTLFSVATRCQKDEVDMYVVCDMHTGGAFGYPTTPTNNVEVGIPNHFLPPSLNIHTGTNNNDIDDFDDHQTATIRNSVRAMSWLCGVSATD